MKETEGASRPHFVVQKVYIHTSEIKLAFPPTLRLRSSRPRRRRRNLLSPSNPVVSSNRTMLTMSHKVIKMKKRLDFIITNVFVSSWFLKLLELEANSLCLLRRQYPLNFEITCGMYM